MIEKIRNILASRSKFVSLLLSYFVAQYVLIIMVQFFIIKKHILFYGKLFFRLTTQICKFPPLILPELCDFALLFSLTMLPQLLFKDKHN